VTLTNCNASISQPTTNNTCALAGLF